jgi:hypothetical protein
MCQFCCFGIPFRLVRFFVLRISPSVYSIIVIWYSWGRFLNKSKWSLCSNIVSTLSNFCGFCVPFSLMGFLELWISPSVYSIIVVWYSWCRFLNKSKWSLCSNIVSTLCNFCCFGVPFSLMRFLELWISPSINSVIVIWDSWGRFLDKCIVSAKSLLFCFFFPLCWV